jgi:hypothetical protein
MTDVNFVNSFVTDRSTIKTELTTIFSQHVSLKVLNTK